MRPPSPGPPADRQKATSMATNGKPSVERLHQPSNLQLQDTMRRLTSSPEDRSLLAAALSCLNSASAAGGAEDLWSESQQDNDVFTTSVPLLRPGSPPLPPHGRSVSISVVPCSRVPAEGAAEPPCPTERAQKSCSAKTSRTPPPPSRKLLHLLPHIVLTRSKSQESQLVGRTEELGTHRTWKRSRLPAAGHTNGSDESGSRSPPRSARAPGPGPAAAVTPLNNATVHRSSPQAQRKDIGLAVTHRFSTKSWLSQTCEVCCRSMMFGVKCKHCKLKCHNKCTKDAPLCRISILTHPRIRRAESVPSDINNRIDHTAAISLQYGTLPSVISKRPEYSCSSNQLDCSSNPSSANSSAPSSPTRLQKSDPPSGVATPPPNPPPQEFQNSCFHFPDVPVSTQIAAAHHSGTYHEPGMLPEIIDGSQHVVPTDGEGEAEGKERSEDENAVGEKCDDEDGLEELPRYIGRRVNRWRGPITRKASQTSMYLQEWDIPYQQLQLEELIGKGRWGKVHKGRWHGEVAIRLLEIDGTNQEHLKLFKKEVMNYRQTRHENVVLFMGACLAPPHLAIVTSFCRGVTLYSMVRERGHVLDINKTRQIAQEIVKGMGYLHAKGIIHKDLKSKNVFYDTNRVVITDFGLFGMSGVVQEGRRKNELRIPRGWVYYLAPEIVRKMSPLKEEDQLPFSKAADVYAFGTVWYELQVGDWPVTDQPMEAKIWLLGSGEGVKGLLAEGDLGKEVTEILSTCWSEEAGDRATFVQLADMLERLPKLNRRLSHPGHFWKSSEYAS